MWAAFRLRLAEIAMEPDGRQPEKPFEPLYRIRRTLVRPRTPLNLCLRYVGSCNCNHRRQQTR
jgi:hypothetical protein